MFNPADDPLLNEQKEDNQIIEPEFYMPIVPMVLINGAEGIGTGEEPRACPYRQLRVNRMEHEYTML